MCKHIYIEFSTGASRWDHASGKLAPEEIVNAICLYDTWNNAAIKYRLVCGAIKMENKINTMGFVIYQSSIGTIGINIKPPAAWAVFLNAT